MHLFYKASVYVIVLLFLKKHSVANSGSESNPLKLLDL